MTRNLTPENGFNISATYHMRKRFSLIGVLMKEHLMYKNKHFLMEACIASAKPSKISYLRILRIMCYLLQNTFIFVFLLFQPGTLRTVGDCLFSRSLLRKASNVSPGWRQSRCVRRPGARIKCLYQKQGQEAEWERYITNLRNSNKSLRALKEELDKRGL